MFDIGFWELATLGVIGLIVLGPERLPVVARTMGRWVRRARHYANNLTEELEKEVATSEIRDAVRSTRERIESETRDISEDARTVMAPLNEPVEGRKDAEEASAHEHAVDASEADEMSETTNSATTESGHAPDGESATEGDAGRSNASHAAGTEHEDRQ